MIYATATIDIRSVDGMVQSSLAGSGQEWELDNASELRLFTSTPDDIRLCVEMYGSAFPDIYNSKCWSGGGCILNCDDDYYQVSLHGGIVE